MPPAAFSHNPSAEPAGEDKMSETIGVTHDVILELRRAYRLSNMQGAMLRLLLDHNIVPSSKMAECSGSNVGVAVFRLRQRLSDHKIFMQSMRGLGFWLKPEDRERLVDEAIRGVSHTPAPAPADGAACKDIVAVD